MDTYDVVIIGSGQAGNPLASSFANNNKSVALIENDKIGGTCINNGCTPSKTLIGHARKAYIVNHADKWGIDVENVQIKTNEIFGNRDAIVEEFRSAKKRQFDRMENIEVIRGEASFVNNTTLDIRSPGKIQRIQGDKIFINTGQIPRIPDIDGIDEVPYLTSRQLLHMDVVPDHLVIIGGGYIGCEMGQAYSRLGSEVTIIQRGSHLLSREDTDIAKKVKDIFENEGIEILCNATPSKVHRQNGKIQIEVRPDSTDGQSVGNTTEVVGSHLLIAAGRIPNTEALNLENTGIEMEDGLIQVTDKLQTSVDHIYALGDVRGKAAFTHISYDDYRIIRDNLIEEKDASIQDRHVPYVVFIDPQLARIGMSQEQAERRDLDYKVASLSMEHVARAIEINETNGMMKAIVDNTTNKILGFTMLGYEAGEVMSVMQMAIIAEIPYTQIQNMVFAHPTISESLNNLFMYGFD